ncbi:hypothetical protein NLU13_8766 [Sarocladium strictum]|uniref:Carboxylic ester hydrolase n=1 Tax=Sarocladium strictum TaxID=5046 RepID=A0AA39L5G6_SARSR|nr:hypothetical protein NLU13_8766 [Sarocladium strictum]
MIGKMLSFQSFLLAFLLASLGAAVSPTVDLGYVKYRGQSLPNGLTQWLGMRYAAPPTGNLRFQPPHDPLLEEDVQPADKHGPFCLATGADPEDPETSEDCLFVEVTAPTKANSRSKLPVFFYIQGGGFNSNSNPNINSSGLIKAAKDDLVVVTFNYRVGLWGFLSNGEKVSQNNGLRDQRKALEWVQANIAKFGGDPGHVVIGGNSAGAASVSMHLTAGNGTDRHLFHGALAGSPSYATMYTVKQSQYQYNNLVTRLGCAGSESLECLRKKPAKEIQAANFNIPLLMASNPPLYQWLPTIDNDFIPDFAYRTFSKGKFVKVPTIFGDDANSGTIFTPKNASTLAESNQFLLDQYPTLTPEQLGEINKLYPNPNRTCPSRGCYWRQVSNVYQEARYMCPALFMNAAISQHGQPRSYAYLWNVEDPEQVASGLGVPHTVEVKAMFAPGYPKTQPSYEEGGINAKAVHVLQAYWTSFIRTLDPNKYRLEGSARWEQWTSKSAERLVFGTRGTTKMAPIGELKTRCDYWQKNGLDMLL